MISDKKLIQRRRKALREYGQKDRQDTITRCCCAAMETDNYFIFLL